jgi:hypothetical protein
VHYRLDAHHRRRARSGDRAHLVPVGQEGLEATLTNARTKDEVTRAATRAIRRHCRRFKPITFDNGTEFHDYALLEERFPVKIYFATPYHSSERGSNENFNGLVRQYLPKGTCMSSVTQAQCDHIVDDLNNRPRKRLGFNTPADLEGLGRIVSTGTPKQMTDMIVGEIPRWRELIRKAGIKPD